MRLSVALFISAVIHGLLFFSPGIELRSKPHQNLFMIVDRLGGLSHPALHRKGFFRAPAPQNDVTGLGGLAHKILEGNPKPPYPMAARKMRLQGTAIVQILVSKSGGIKEIVFQQRTGHSVLDQAIINTVKEWNIPAPEKEGWITLPPFEFRLKKDS